MRRLGLLLCLIMIAIVHSGAGCSSTSWCEERCESELREELINNFGVPPDQIDCGDGSWDGDCGHCQRVLVQRFQVKLDCSRY